MKKENKDGLNFSEDIISDEILRKIEREYPMSSNDEKWRLCQAEVLIQAFEADTCKKRDNATIEEMNEYFKKKKKNKSQ